jgi:hypothetical protein
LARHGARLDVENDDEQVVICAALDRRPGAWPHASVIRALASLGAFDLSTTVMERNDRTGRLRPRSAFRAGGAAHERFPPRPAEAASDGKRYGSNACAFGSVRGDSPRLARC